MFVLNEIVQDGRVLREAKSLAKHHDLLLLGYQRSLTEQEMAEARKEHGLDIWWAPTSVSGLLPKRGIIGYGARYIEVRRRIINKIRSYRPDVIHAHEASGLSIGHRAAKRTGAKLIYDAHELYREMTGAESYPWHGFLARQETRLMQDCDAIIACNEERAEVMLNEYGAPYLPTVLENMPPARTYKRSTTLLDYARQRNPSVEHVVLYQGACMPGRGLEAMVDAVSRLDERTALVMVGPGGKAFMDVLKAKIAALSMDKRCFLHPAVSYDELFDLTCSADVGIVSYQPVSRNNLLCAPNKLYEYAQAALPIVGADLPPIRRFLEETSTGLTMNPDDPDSIADAIRGVLADPQTTQAYRDAGLAAAEVYCWDKRQNRMLGLYDNLLGAA